MSKHIKTYYILDGGTCAAPCKICNANCIHIDIDNQETGEFHEHVDFCLCEKHAENLAIKILKKLGYDPEKLRDARN